MFCIPFQHHFVVSCKVQWGAYSVLACRWVQEVTMHFQVFIFMQQKREQLWWKKLLWYSLPIGRTHILLHTFNGPPQNISMRSKSTAEKTFMGCPLFPSLWLCQWKSTFMLHPQFSFLNVHILQYSNKENHVNIHAASEFKQTKI